MPNEIEKGFGDMSEKDGSTAVLHTAVIKNAYEMWSKLLWDVEVFQDTQQMYPDEKEPLGFAAINACISIAAFVDWVVQAAATGQKRQFLDDYPEFLMFVAIANTSKHNRHRDKDSAQIEAKMVWFDGTEDAPPAWQLFYDSPGESITAYERFDKIKRVAWNVLETFNLTGNRPSGPEWYTRKMLRIFPPISDEEVQLLIRHHEQAGE